MAKIYIQIELESGEDQTPELLNALSQAFLGATKVEPTTPVAKSPVEEKEPPKVSVKKTKKVAEAEEPKEPTFEPGGGLVEDESEAKPEKTEETPEENYTVDDVRTIMAEAKRSGKDAASLRAILKANGAAVVSDLDPKKYASVIKAVKAL